MIYSLCHVNFQLTLANSMYQIYATPSPNANGCLRKLWFESHSLCVRARVGFCWCVGLVVIGAGQGGVVGGFVDVECVVMTTN